MADDQRPSGTDHALSRRRLLVGGAAAGLGAAGAIGVGALASRPRGSASVSNEPARVRGDRTVSFYGPHQAGITVTPQSHINYIAIDLADDMDRSGLARMMQLLSSDAARLTQGTPALADSEPELATVPARLTVTFGFGPELVARAGGAAPRWLRPLPAFTVDRLEDAYSHGDLLIAVAADDPVTVAHATRMLLKDTRSFGTVRWRQAGFRRTPGSERPGTTMRNLFGQVDGTVNPEPGDADFASVVWSAGAPAWMAGGTSFVFRRIHMNLDSWDQLDRSGREHSLGRTLANGAPLTGVRETDEPDFAATTAIGFPVIPAFSHIRRARSDNSAQRIHRRGYNYDDAPAASGVSNSGLLFGSYQADVDAQFVPIQRRLDELDLLNRWTTPVGSAVFAIPPGCDESGFIGDTLL